MTERVRPGDAVLAKAGVDAHLEELRGKLRAPRRAKRALAKSGGVTITPAQRAWAKRAAESLARGETPADVTKPKRGAKVLRRNRVKSPW